jgi:hypothetical protein
VGTVARKAKVPALVGTTAAAAIAGGVALGSRLSNRGHHGSSVPGRALHSTADQFSRISKEIGRAGLRVGIGEVDLEVRKSGHDSESRQSPLEALVTALTSRRSDR